MLEEEPLAVESYKFYNRVIQLLVAKVRGLLNILNLAFFKDPYIKKYR